MRKLIRFFKNAWYFRSELSKHDGMDYFGSLSLFKRSLESIYDTMVIHEVKSFVVEKKLDKIKRAIAIINRIDSADYYELSIKQINMDFKSSPTYNEEISFSRFNENNTEEIQKAIMLSIELEEKDWIKLWTLLKNRSYGLRSWYL